MSGLSILTFWFASGAGRRKFFVNEWKEEEIGGRFPVFPSPDSLPTSKEDRHAEISVNSWLNSNCRSSYDVRV
jgi:hypothetical protein